MKIYHNNFSQNFSLDFNTLVKEIIILFVLFVEFIANKSPFKGCVSNIHIYVLGVQKGP